MLQVKLYLCRLVCIASEGSALAEEGLLLEGLLLFTLADCICLSSAVWRTWYQPGPTFWLVLLDALEGL